VSLYKGPFWRDDNLVLLSDVDPTTLKLITDTQGAVIPTGAATGVVPAGRHARITKVEFPTAMVVAGRMVYSPRYNPWVYLSIDGEDPTRPEVLVLREGMKSRDEFLAVLDRYLTAEDLTAALAGYPEDQRKAIFEKRIVDGLDTAGVEMAWGYPDHKRIEVRDGHRSETWSYAGGQRQVSLADGKVTGSQEGIGAAKP
jgi:hypothetical protein